MLVSSNLLRRTFAVAQPASSHLSNINALREYDGDDRDVDVDRRPERRCILSVLRSTSKRTMLNPKAAKTTFFFHLILFSIFFTCRSDDPDCVYTVFVRTGSIIKGGTDSIISLTLYDADNYGIRINNLESWGGLMGPDYNYFERGNLDIFSGRGPCLTGPVCAMNLTSDGSGSGHGWYVNYVEVTTTGVHEQCAQKQFTVEQWLATDTSPYELTVIKNYCSSSSKKKSRRVMAGSDLPMLSVM